jgi:phosphosulfolactate synthase
VNETFSIGHVPLPNFLELPGRPAKPRTAGLTHVLDKGTSVASAAGTLDLAAPYIDVWKFGWGTAYLDPQLPDKLDLLVRNGVRSCPGGTLLEIAWSQGKAAECLAWARDLGFDAVEISRGIASMTIDEKRELIRIAAGSFVVFSEVGRKDPCETLSAQQWTNEVAADLDAGARWVIAEGRESGSVGLYRADGSVRAEIVAAVVRGGGPESVLFEAPRKEQQSWFIREFGPNVNLANVAPADALALETLRRGLRADTFELSRQWLPA